MGLYNQYIIMTFECLHDLLLPLLSNIPAFSVCTVKGESTTVECCDKHFISSCFCKRNCLCKYTIHDDGTVLFLSSVSAIF